jgi:ribonuclease BN (tRNA processing enzyme)
MKLSIIGCGDAFGSGGRLHTCFHVEAAGSRFLIDCGATALIGMQRLGLDTNGVGSILISHLHGDHFAGLVWWLMHAHYVAKRAVPLTIAGPPGTEARLAAASEALFPGSTGVPRRFEVRFCEYRLEAPLAVGPLRVTPWEVEHPSGAPSCALRIECGGKVLAFSGDTQWVDTLLPVSAGADLFLIECYGYETDVRYHLSWAAISRRLPEITARRIMLTHMNSEMLANRHKVSDPRVLLAEDGLVVEV